MKSAEQQYEGRIGQNQQIKANSSDLALIQEKIKEAKTLEEREQIYSELKKVPHLLNAYFKYCKKVFRRLIKWMVFNFTKSL
jgi:hypothetical protein